MGKCEVNKTTHTIEVLGRRLVIYTALLWYWGMGSQTDCTERSCLKIEELKNFARYDLCSVTRSYPNLLVCSYALLCVQIVVLAVYVLTWAGTCKRFHKSTVCANYTIARAHKNARPPRSRVSVCNRAKVKILEFCYF